VFGDGEHSAKNIVAKMAGRIFGGLGGRGGRGVETYVQPAT